MTMQAIEEAGRPGMAVCAPNTSASAIGTVSVQSYGGMRPTDWQNASFMSELKVPYEDLIRTSHFIETNSFVHNFYNPIFGGFAGGVEGTAIATVAGFILMKATLFGDSFNTGVSHAHYSFNTFPSLIVSQAVAMQALSRKRALTPARPGHPGRFEFEYKRNGTRCLFACFNVGTGKVLGQCTMQRKRTDFLSFMDRVASAYRQRRVHVILDNLNTHRDTTQGAFMTEWNERHGNRFVFHYTPTHASWLNQVELWFGVLTRRILRYGNFHSPDELVQAVMAFLQQWNETEAHPFRWTYDGLPLVR